MAWAIVTRSDRRERHGVPDILGRLGAWRSLVAHPAGGRAVGGSNPLAPMQDLGDVEHRGGASTPLSYGGQATGS